MPNRDHQALIALIAALLAQIAPRHRTTIVQEALRRAAESAPRVVR